MRMGGALGRVTISLHRARWFRICDEEERSRIENEETTYVSAALGDENRSIAKELVSWAAVEAAPLHQSLNVVNDSGPVSHT